MSRLITVATTAVVALVAVSGCRGPETRPCQTTTYLLPEDDVLRQVQYHYEDDELMGTTTLVGAQGDVLETADYMYDDDGRALGQLVQGQDDDGQPVVTAVSYSFDADERLISEEWFVDDQLERRIDYVHDDEGRLIEEQYYGEGPTPVLVRALRHHYGEAGWLDATDADNDGDGVWDWRTDYVYDPDGLPLTIESGPVGGGVSERTDYLYDLDGRLVQETEDTNADDEPDALTRYTYDDDGRLVGVDVDQGDDGSVERRREFHYDDEDRLVSEVELVAERDGDEPTASERVTSSRTEYNYDCWER